MVTFTKGPLYQEWGVGRQIAGNDGVGERVGGGWMLGRYFTVYVATVAYGLCIGTVHVATFIDRPLYVCF